MYIEGPSPPSSRTPSTEISRALVPVSSSTVHKRNTPHPQSSTETSRALVPISSPPDGKVPQTPSVPRRNSKQEAEWKNALENLERQATSYQNLLKGGKATEQDAERVYEAFENVADSHTDPKVKAHFKQKAQEFRGAGPKEREEILGDILKGFLVLLATPFLAVGAALFTAGMILRGVGLGLKMAGQFAVNKLAFWRG